MSSSCGSVCLLVSLGVVLACGSPVKSPDTAENLLMLKEPEVGREPLFTSIIRSINTSCQSKEDIRLINATLDVYQRVFSSILHHQHHHLQQQRGGAAASGLLDKLSGSNRARVQAHLEKLQDKMEELRRRLSRVNPDRRDEQDMLRELNRIQVDDPLDQRKALAEFQLVYSTASAFH